VSCAGTSYSGLPVWELRRIILTGACFSSLGCCGSRGARGRQASQSPQVQSSQLQQCSGQHGIDLQRTHEFIFKRYSKQKFSLVSQFITRD